LDKACGSRRHCYNQLLEHFSQETNKWSKYAAYQYYIKTIRPQFDWYSEVSSRVTRNAIDDLDNAFKHFFRRIKASEKAGFPRFKRKDVKDSFALREKAKFDVDGRLLRIEKLKSKIKMRQRLRFDGQAKQVTISQRAGKYCASILIETQDYNPKDVDRQATVGVDFGIKSLATLSNGVVFGANQKLKANLKKLKKARLRNGEIIIADRFFPSSKTCSDCGSLKKDLSLSERTYHCDCGLEIDRDLNAAINLKSYGEDRLQPTKKRT
jgi:putative transposase